MADRPVQEAANRPSPSDGADAPATSAPVLPPMPDNGAKPANGRSRTRRSKAPTAPQAQPPAGPVGDDDTAVRPAAGQPVRANLSRGQNPQAAQAPAPAPTARPANPGMSPGPAAAAPPTAPPATPPGAPQTRPVQARPAAAPVMPPQAPPAGPPMGAPSGPRPDMVDPEPTRRSRRTRGAAAPAAAMAPAVAPSPAAAPAPHAPRRARLRLTRIDPWSIMKVAFLLSIAIGIVTVVAVMTVWSILGAAGVWDSINTTVASVIGGEDGNNFNVTDYVGMSRVLGFTSLVAVADVVLLTALATLAAFLYNMAAALLGGVEVTLAEDDD